MHFTIQAWEGFTSAGLAIYHLASSRTPGLRRQIGILAAISLYFAASSALQITSSGVLGIEVYNVPTSMVSTAALNSLGSFLGFDSTPGELAEPPSSNEDTSAVNRGIWQVGISLHLLRMKPVYIKILIGF
ncbi:hypothetical protein DL93DRAFT_2076879 [Clavulina sp. PMI_390]|nr:hypothetical protein DL93DRAFT_2076879 [Clavulina sp. PMI_390]